MGNKSLGIFVLIFYCDVALCSYYAVVASRSHQFKSAYRVHLSYDTTDAQAKLNMKLVGKDDDNDIGPSQPVNCNGDFDCFITFDTKRLDKLQDYTLVVWNSADRFNQSVTVHTIAKIHSVFIQTDKAIYKHGDEVRFRVFVLDAEKKPYQFQRLIITVGETYGEIVYNRTLDENDFDPFDELRVFESNMTISEGSFFGKWNMNVWVDDDSLPTIKSFKVEEYVLPRFEAFVKTKTSLSKKDSGVNLSVWAKYNNDEYVTGKAKITLNVYDTKGKLFRNHFSSINNITKLHHVEILVKRDLEILHLITEYRIDVEVVFEEELTKKTRTAKATIIMKQEPDFLIQVFRSSRYLKPGFPYDLKVVVRQTNGELETGQQRVDVEAELTFDLPRCTSIQERDNANSKMTLFLTKRLNKSEFNLSLDIPSNTTSMRLKLTYFGAVKTEMFARLPTICREYIQAKVITTRIKAGQNVRIDVKSTYYMDRIFYVVIGRTGSLSDKTADLEGSTIETRLNLKTESWMAPEAHVFIYFIHYSGEIVYDRVTLVFEADPNKLEITSPLEAHPGDALKLDFKTTPGSKMFLLGVDKSVNLLKSGNNIDEKRVLEDMKVYDAYKSYDPLVINGNYGDRRYLGFGTSNAFILTNAYTNISADCSLNPRVDSLTVTNPDVPAPKYNYTPPEEIKSKLRTNFSEVILFESIDADENGMGHLGVKLPDTITTWDITGFTLSKEKGLGIAKSQSVVVSQNFFVELNLPYSIRFGEVLKLEVIVFNFYKKQDTLHPKVTVYSRNLGRNDDGASANSDEIDNESEFDFYEGSSVNGICKLKKSITENDEEESSQVIQVNPNSGTKVHFFIKPRRAGSINITVKAEFTNKRKKNVFDEVVRNLTVEHEGITQYKNHAFFIDLREKSHDSFQMSIPIDTESRNSIKISSSVIGDLIGPAIENTDKLLNIPTGCAEQMLVAFVPNIAAMDYLNATNQLTKDRRELGEKALRTGYQDILLNKMENGAFSIWKRNKKEPSDSIWLTAYVAKCFGKAKHLIAINDKHVSDALRFLSEKQENDGRFPESGTVSYWHLQSASSVGIPLTAFTAIAFLENKAYHQTYKDTIKKSLSYISENFEKLTDDYAMSIATYAMALGNHESANQSLNALLEKSVLLKGMRYWKESSESTMKSTLVETAAYALLALVKTNRALEAAPVVKWLVSQRNNNGGFYSTQDTVIGLEALAAISHELYEENTNMNLNLNFGQGASYADEKFEVRKANKGRLQKRDLLPNVNSVSVNAKGSGIASFQVSYSYKIKVPEADESLSVEITVRPTNRKNTIHLTICARYKPKEEEQIKKTNMALMEIVFPTGFIFDEDFDMLSTAPIKKYELRYDKTTLILYFDYIDETLVCPQVEAFRVKPVMNLKAASVQVYDYKNEGIRATEYYNAPSSQMC